VQRLGVFVEVARDLCVTARLHCRRAAFQVSRGDPPKGFGRSLAALSPLGSWVAPIVDIFPVFASFAPSFLETKRRPSTELHAIVLFAVFVLEHPNPGSRIADAEAEADDAIAVAVVEKFQFPHASR
jgi:hypothetical protein